MDKKTFLGFGMQHNEKVVRKAATSIANSPSLEETYNEGQVKEAANKFTTVERLVRESKG